MIRQILGASSTPTPRIGGEKLENPHLQGGQLGNGLVPGARVDHQNLEGISGYLVMVETMGKIPTLASANLGGNHPKVFFSQIYKTKHPKHSMGHGFLWMILQKSTSLGS